VTITCARLPERNDPSEAYRGVVARGLGESWGLSTTGADRYLNGWVGDDG